MSTLRVILGDQLSHSLSSLRGADPSLDEILMAEVSEETSYVAHHKKKIVLVLSAMRHFAEELKERGFRVHYIRLDDPDNTHSLVGEVKRCAQRFGHQRVVLTEPSEWRVREAFSKVPMVEMIEDSRFVCTHTDFEKWAAGRKQLRMEYFYRDMRRKTGLLMQKGEPIGGKWNYDQENRKPAADSLFMPQPPMFEPDEITSDVLSLVETRHEDNFGDLTPFWFATTRDQALQALDYFVTHALDDFGPYQDAMLKGQAFLYHSVLSLYINIGLLSPLEVCQKIEAAYLEGKVALNSAEGYIRQIIGWREYVRGIYWLKMPDYQHENFFEAERPLPAFYWSGETHMACMHHAITQTKTQAYAHHIQRLMVTGNFALIAGINPQELHEWYLAVYADAFEWVELPNTLGMSQFGDGGLLASKPYASSGNYIDKMSDYCRACRYKVKEKTGENSCPFNSLYWDFLIRNRDKISKNPRISMVYRTWDKMSKDRQDAYLKTAMYYLTKLDAGEKV